MQLLDYGKEYQQFDLDGLDRHSNDYQLSGVSLATETHAPNATCCAACSSRCTYAGRTRLNSIKPMYTIAAFGFCAVFEPSDLADRVGLCAVLFLSIYAVQWTRRSRPCSTT